MSAHFLCMSEGEHKVVELDAEKSEHNGSGWYRVHFVCGSPYGAVF